MALRRAGPRRSAPGTPEVGGWGQEVEGRREFYLDDVILLHLQRLGRLVVVDPAAVEEESEGGDGHPACRQGSTLVCFTYAKNMKLIKLEAGFEPI